VDVITLPRIEPDDPLSLASELVGIDAIVHLAGVNRGDDHEVARENVSMAQALSEAALKARVPKVVYANTVRQGDGTVYGESKAEAARVLSVVSENDADFVDVRLPNLFGEHGKPDYNSFVATFCQRLAVGESPEIHADRQLELLHVQDAARHLLDAAVQSRAGALQPSGTLTSVADVAAILAGQADSYAAGVFPDFGDPFEVRLFNQLRSYAQPFNVADDRPTRFDNPRSLDGHEDERGRLVEVVKAHGGESQAFFSSTLPGVTRGNHFHTGKVERFAVIRGEAEIALRRVGTDDSYRFVVSGSRPQIVDIPTLHTHAITNIGPDELLTLFWADEIFDRAASDTYPERVAG
jgi:UDP-2-acetamido-2,6-beta-L-arabino-hexul-4-ose reductase